CDPAIYTLEAFATMIGLLTMFESGRARNCTTQQSRSMYLHQLDYVRLRLPHERRTNAQGPLGNKRHQPGQTGQGLGVSCSASPSVHLVLPSREIETGNSILEHLHVRGLIGHCHGRCDSAVEK